MFTPSEQESIMPFHYSSHQSPSGMSYLRVEASGNISYGDGEGLAAAFLRNESGQVLSVVNKGTVYSPEVRTMFPSLQDKYRALGAVVPSPLLRAAINFMWRLAPRGGGVFRMFNDEVAAIEWLEAQSL